jgi:hypothetical protein
MKKSAIISLVLTAIVYLTAQGWLYTLTEGVRAGYVLGYTDSQQEGDCL